MYLWVVYRLGLVFFDYILIILNYLKGDIMSIFFILKGKVFYVYYGIFKGFELFVNLVLKKGVFMFGGDSY